MKYAICYGERVSAFPDAALEIDDMNALRLLLLLCSDKEMSENFDVTAAAGRLGLGEDEVTAAAEELVMKKLVRENLDITVRSGLALSGIIEKTENLRGVIDECARLCGVVSFNTTDLGRIVSLVEDLKMDCEAVVLLFSYLSKELSDDGRRLNALYAVRAAYRLKILSADKMTEYISTQHEKNSLTAKLKALFGMNGKPLTEKQKKFFAEWTEEWKYGYDVIKLARDMAEDKGIRSIEYIHAILNRWHDKGISTAEQAEEEIAKHKSESGKSEGFSSFDVDDFFRDALNRSYEEGN